MNPHTLFSPQVGLVAHLNYLSSKTIFFSVNGRTGEGVGNCAGVGVSGVDICGGVVLLGVVWFCVTTFSGSKL